MKSLLRRPRPPSPRPPLLSDDFTNPMSTTLPPFEEIVTRHGPTVLRVCRAVLGPMDADDTWSETFLAALRAYPTLGPGSNVEAWLVTIAHRKAIDQTRARARRPLAVDHLPERPAPIEADRLDGGSVGRHASPTVQAARSGGLPLHRRDAIRGRGRPHRWQSGRRPASSRRRHRHTTQDL